MDVIQQNLVVKDWPLQKPGDEMFFGYVVALGVFPRGWTEEEMFLFVDFAYGDRYTRYRLPNDESLRAQLAAELRGNMAMFAEHGDLYGKVWVRLTGTGYKVEQP